MRSTPSLFAVPPRILPPLDPAFRPLALGVRRFRQALPPARDRVQVRIALEQDAARVARLDLEVFPEGAGRDGDNLRYVSWMLNFLLWSRGGWRVSLAAPGPLGRALAAEYAPGGPRAFDADLMTRAFGRPFTVACVPPDQVPPARALALALGGHLEGCRIGFDLGASDYKVAALQDGQVVFSAELPWNPKVEPDPAYHLQRIEEGLRLAASRLPRVDAIGGSSAGILVDNQIRVASLFRAVPEATFQTLVKGLFQELQARWKVPLEVINDGEVTALAGGLSLERNAILGIAMGSSEASGYLDPAGRITGWLNELAFAPVDASPEGGVDDWSGNPGTGAAYFSQQAVDRLAAPAGFSFPPDMPLPERLKAVQEAMEAGDPRARALFETIGVHLGYTLPWYAEFYAMEQTLILGRVTSGAGGEVILARAREVLASEFPGEAARLSVILPDEQSRRVGQAVAAASLPPLPNPGGLHA